MVVIAAVAIGVLALGGGNDATTATRPTSSNAGPGVTFTLKPATSPPTAQAPRRRSPQAQAQQVLGTIRTYVDTAVIKPLRSGKPAGDLSSVFDAGTLARATGVDRSVMLEEGLPKVTGDIVVTGKPVSFVGLGDQGGNLVLVTAVGAVTVDGTISGSRRRSTSSKAATSCSRPTQSGAWKVTGVQHGRHPQRRRCRHDHGGSPATTGVGQVNRRPPSHAARAGAHARCCAACSSPAWSAAAWLALGSPTPGACRGVDADREDAAKRATRALPTSRSSCSSLGTGARSDDPAESPDDPGLADAIHVIGVNPALEARRRSSTSPATPKARAARRSTPTS